MKTTQVLRAGLVRELAFWVGPSVAGALAVGCGATVDHTACIDVLETEECPTEGDARKLMPDFICNDPELRYKSGATFVERLDAGPSGGWDTGNSEYWDTHDACCYEAKYKEIPGSSCVIGRPALQDGRPIVAPVRSGPVGSRSPCGGELSPSDRRAVGALWREIAQLEHASVAAFARVVAELTALGAPPELIDATRDAQTDEVRHAQLAFALASSYLDTPLQPGAMPSLDRPVPSLAELAAETATEGCIGETLSVLLAGAQLARATHPQVVAALERIVADESRHAELAWRTVEWALETGDAHVRQAVVRAFAEAALPQWMAAPVQSATDAHAHGWLGAHEARAVVCRGLQRVVGPAARALLDDDDGPGLAA